MPVNLTDVFNFRHSVFRYTTSDMNNAVSYKNILRCTDKFRVIDAGVYLEGVKYDRYNKAKPIALAARSAAARLLGLRV
jgi:hypothetical protein